MIKQSIVVWSRHTPVWFDGSNHRLWILQRQQTCWLKFLAKFQDGRQWCQSFPHWNILAGALYAVWDWRTFSIIDEYRICDSDNQQLLSDKHNSLYHTTSVSIPPDKSDGKSFSNRDILRNSMVKKMQTKEVEFQNDYLVIKLVRHRNTCLSCSQIRWSLNSFSNICIEVRTEK